MKNRFNYPETSRAIAIARAIPQPAALDWVLLSSFATILLMVFSGF
jgi:hypothetical protein